MGAARALYTNMITAASMLTPTSERAGVVGIAVKRGTGSATAQAGGSYTGATSPRQYVVEIDSVAGGTEVGQATFRWRPGDATTWSASGVATSSSPVTLESGITIFWTGGSGADFALADRWTITVDKPFGKAGLLDRDRDTEWRSVDASALVRIVVDLGSAQAPDVIALLDHNLRSTATLAVKANASDAWGSPPLSETITWQDDHVLRYLQTTPRSYRYWALELTDVGNPDGYLRASELFLGGYLELSQNFDPGWRRGRRAAAFGPAGDLRLPRGVSAMSEIIELDYRVLPAADRASLLALWAAIYDERRGTVQPFILNFDPADPADVSLYEWEEPEIMFRSPFLNRFEGTLRLVQRPRLARSGT
jgi:hypothetical protein